MATSVDARYRFLRACFQQDTDHVPVWFMRQAGRSLPEYRALRGEHSMLDLCRTPDLIVEVTLQPVRRYGVDAAILFSDIVVPLQGVGIGLDIVEGKGPVIDRPIRRERDLDRLRPLEPSADVPFVLEAIEALADDLAVPLIGFAGAPFTLASYLIEGGPSRQHTRTKALMYSETHLWHRLMERLADITLSYLRAQVEAGAGAIQLFDSWVGALSPDDFVTYALPSVERILNGLGDLNVPRIYFGVGTGELLSAMANSGCDVLGVDWRTPLDVARRRTEGGVALQGNLDPAACLGPAHVMEERARDVLRRGGGGGHIFNLGHGVLPETDAEALARLVDVVHAWSPDDE
ncbi:MAG: uroporphyrinogen decarboxylase [Actinobacteria bacterium]|nr:uroporphyrinogen decarboxylase [Actinomycetota bacterium]